MPCATGEPAAARPTASLTRRAFVSISGTVIRRTTCWDSCWEFWPKGNTVQLAQLAAAHLLARIKNNLVFRPLGRLRDGSYVAKLYPLHTKQQLADRSSVTVRKPRFLERLGAFAVFLAPEAFLDLSRAGEDPIFLSPNLFGSPGDLV